jgi:saccharopine dehydrogenase (NAD+, L-lysine-forming)
MNKLFGIRREDKNRWERRTPLIPEDVKELKDKHRLDCLVQPSRIRVFDDEDYIAHGARVDEDLSKCPVVFAIKEIPLDFFKEDVTYVFFAHVIKGQSYNMSMLKRMLDLSCTLIDYEKIVDERGQRLIAFGHHAGVSGMIDTLWALGRRLDWEGLDVPFAEIRQTHEYETLAQAKDAVTRVGQVISAKGLPESLRPFVCGFSGYGRVSLGAQEIFDLLPVRQIAPAALKDLFENNGGSDRELYKVVFKEEDLVIPKQETAGFDLQEYYDHPERYRSRFEDYLPHMSVLMNAIYWSERYPHLVTKNFLRGLFAESQQPRLRVIGDISCDIEGAIGCTLHVTDPDTPVFTYDPLTGRATDGFAGRGVVVMAVDNLPCELPREASGYFSEVLKKYVPGIVQADYSVDFDHCSLPPAIKRAVIVYQGELTPNFQYLEEYL